MVLHTFLNRGSGKLYVQYVSFWSNLKSKVVALRDSFRGMEWMNSAEIQQLNDDA